MRVAKPESPNQGLTHPNQRYRVTGVRPCFYDRLCFWQDPFECLGHRIELAFRQSLVGSRLLFPMSWCRTWPGCEGRSRLCSLILDPSFSISRCRIQSLLHFFFCPSHVTSSYLPCTSPHYIDFTLIEHPLRSSYTRTMHSLSLLMRMPGSMEGLD